jgi:hypothetical protein
MNQSLLLWPQLQCRMHHWLPFSNTRGRGISRSRTPFDYTSFFRFSCHRSSVFRELSEQPIALHLISKIMTSTKKNPLSLFMQSLLSEVREEEQKGRSDFELCNVWVVDDNAKCHGNSPPSPKSDSPRKASDVFNDICPSPASPSSSSTLDFMESWSQTSLSSSEGSSPRRSMSYPVGSLERNRFARRSLHYDSLSMPSMDCISPHLDVATTTKTKMAPAAFTLVYNHYV